MFATELIMQLEAECQGESILINSTLIFDRRGKFLNVFKGSIFPKKNTKLDDDDDLHGKTLIPECPTKNFKKDAFLFGSAQGREIKILPSKQLLLRLPVLLAQV